MFAPRCACVLLCLLGLSCADEDAQRIARGRKLYNVSCGACHQPDGQGKYGVASPLVDSPWVLESVGRLVRIALHGVRGEIEVNGVMYNLEMPAFGTVHNDDDLAAILSYIRQAWGHRAAPISRDTVAAIRSELADRGDSWTAEELLAIP